MLKTSQDPVTGSIGWYLKDLSPALQQSSHMLHFTFPRISVPCLYLRRKGFDRTGFCGPAVQMGIYHSVLCSLLAYRSRILSYGNQDEAEEVSKCLPLLLVLHHGMMKAHNWTWKLRSSLALLDWKCQIKHHKPSPLS